MTKKPKIKVALFTDVLTENLDGVTYTIHNLLAGVPKDRYEFVIITAYPPKEVKLPYKIIICKYIHFPMYKEYPLALPYFNDELDNTLKEFMPDIIHFTTPSLLARYAIRFGRIHKVPVVTTYHTHFLTYIDYYFKHIPGLSHFWQWLGRIVVRSYYSRCKRTYVPTWPIKDDLVKVGIPEKTLKIWGRGIDTAKFNPSKRDDSYIDGLCGKENKRILFVSRLFWIKEIKTLIRIYHKLNKVRPDIKMVITGDGPQMKYMQKRMPNAVFTGKLIDNDLQRIYASCDLFVFPSITETFGNVVLEALASGIPAVVAAAGGPMGIVEDGVTGLHAEPMKEDDFCNKIISILDDPAKLKEMSSNAVAYAKTQRWENLCREMFQSYEEVIEEMKESERKAREIAN